MRYYHLIAASFVTASLQFVLESLLGMALPRVISQIFLLIQGFILIGYFVLTLALVWVQSKQRKQKTASFIPRRDLTSQKENSNQSDDSDQNHWLKAS